MPCPTTPPAPRGFRVPVPGLLALAFAAFLPLAVSAQWRVEGWFGGAENLPTPVTFSQFNQPDISTTGHWSTRPWQPTWYYGGRIASWSGNSGWAFAYTHHKIYLDNPPEGVAFFRVTNGVNLLQGERLWRRSGWEYGVGAGPVLTVPVSSVRGLVYDNAHGVFRSKYQFGGGVLSANVGRRLHLLPFVYGTASVMGTASYLRVDIADGHARTLNFALHFRYGISLQSKPKG
jgi:hypothetical protein